MNRKFLALLAASIWWSSFSSAAGTMLLEDLDYVFKTNPTLHKTLLDALDLWDRAMATGPDTSRATDKNPPWMLYGRPKGASGPFTVQIELRLAPKSWPENPRLVGLLITPIDPETQKIISK
jgi:hypothetical protein